MTPASEAVQMDHQRHFTVRSVLAGLAVGTVICAANVYFGLQTGWVSIMSMPASLMGFGLFRLLRAHLRFPFSPVENVLLQSVACGMAIMPLGCGLVGVMPAMEYLLTGEEQGPLAMSMAQLMVWSIGLCYFGVVFAVPLRRQVIIRERLRFPSGFSTAILISVLHGQIEPGTQQEHDSLEAAARGGFASLAMPPSLPRQPEREARHEEWHETGHEADHEADDEADDETGRGVEHEPLLSTESGHQDQDSWSNMRLLLLCFAASGLFTICTYFVPVLRELPVFGSVAASTWLWTLNPSPAYIGQGIIMGTETTLHMTLGALVGWAMLSPWAKMQGWAPGPVDDWERGSKGWILWVSLAIMLVDAVVSLGYIALRPAVLHLMRRRAAFGMNYGQAEPNADLDDKNDAPPEQRISGRVVIVGLVLSVLLCIVTVRLVFGDLVPLYATVTAVLMALVLSIMGVRALGETDLNPVSGISKLAQLFFALIIPQSNPASVLINLVAGAISEAGALQAGDLMQDLKTGHLLGAAPRAQFWGQIIGASFGAIVSALLYRLYTTVYTIPGPLFQVPTAYVWIFTARLVTGRGLPPMAGQWAAAAGLLFAFITLARSVSVGKSWRKWLPGGIAVAIGMYNVPSFTLARALGGLFNWYWIHRLKRSSTPLIILASGFILGEGFLSIVNLVLQGFNVPHV
ncbi:hypothetical protein CDD81_8168 [Ophiocordyceps australis]|uniref:OPT superfamily oligopeptide transporter n=1 Tax=Ophiocordyceps australis TaxID=1399860 RepID=A0A2C5XYQ3_9HYPO|nr:hypothetical protein CDD81_8168 [Ophiocordyceps australis]